jgi:hypothetical protein
MPLQQFKPEHLQVTPSQAVHRVSVSPANCSLRKKWNSARGLRDIRPQSCAPLLVVEEVAGADSLGVGFGLPLFVFPT